MAISDLVTSQPTSVTPTEDASVMTTETDSADSTVVNESVVQGQENSQETEGQLSERLQKRFDKLTAEKYEQLQTIAALKAKLETVEQTQKQSNQPKTLNDLSAEQLRALLKNEKYEEFHEEAESLLVKKLAQEEIEKFKSEQKQSEERNKVASISYQLSQAIAGEDINNQDSAIFKKADSKYLQIKNELGALAEHPLAMPFAFALAKLEVGSFGKPASNVVRSNIVNRIEGQNRAAAGGAPSLKDYLSKAKTLAPSRQGASGSLKDAIKHLSIVKDLGE